MEYLCDETEICCSAPLRDHSTYSNAYIYIYFVQIIVAFKTIHTEYSIFLPHDWPEDGYSNMPSVD